MSSNRAASVSERVLAQRRVGLAGHPLADARGSVGNLMSFDAAERAAIVAEWDRQKGEGAIPNWGAFGRPMVFVAVALGLGVTVFVVFRRAILPADATIAMFAAVAMLGLAGALAWVFGAVYAANQAYGRAEHAAQWLAEHHTAGTQERRRAAAVTVLAHAYYRGGPWTLRVYAPRDVARRLASALDYLEKVEGVLSEERGVTRVFSRRLLAV